MTEDEKVAQLAKAFCTKIDAVTTMAQWENLTDNIDKQMVVNFLQNKISLEKDKYLAKADECIAFAADLEKTLKENPFGAPLAQIERVAVKQYFLNKAWPGLFKMNVIFDIVNYQLGCRPGRCMNSLVSGVGVNSPTIAYSPNRADWSYVPGGTFWNAVNLVRPDLPEDKEWPYLWTEREYIIGGATMHLFMILAADHLLDETPN